MNPGVRYLVLFILACIISGIAAAADRQPDQKLTIGLTPEEMTRLDEIGSNYMRTDPPPPPIRNCAEWDPSEGVIIRYPLGLPLDLIADFSKDVKVYCVVSSSYYNSAVSSFTSGGVDMSNVEFIIAATNTYWTRDYGPWFIFDGTGEMGIVDHNYNRPRPQDDVIPQVIGNLWGLNVYGLDLTHTGGNHMSDGLGMSISTYLVYNENPGLSHGQVDSMMLAYLGNDYTVLSYVESSGIHHIDCWAKFLSPSKILLKDVPPSDPSYTLLNARADYLSQQMSAWGAPYEVVRVYCPGYTAYTNSLILNNKVYVPVYGGSYAAYDAQALAAYEAAMPGYAVKGYDGSWVTEDALHCRTMGVPDREMLWVEHAPLHVVPQDEGNYEVGVHIVDHSETGLIADSLKVYYSLNNGSSFESVLLGPTADPDSFLGYIPGQEVGDTVLYYVKAADNSGRVETHPYIGSRDPHIFRVGMAPLITSPDSFICQVTEAFSYYPEFEDLDDTLHTITYSGFPDWLAVEDDTLTGSTPDSCQQVTFTVEVADPYLSGSQDVKLMVYRCGDVNSDDIVNLLDIVQLIQFKYKDGPAPDVWEAGDVNSSGAIDILDITYLINFKYKEGPAPECQ